MKKMRKLIAILMMVCMLVSILPVGVAYADYVNDPDTCSHKNTDETSAWKNGVCELCGLEHTDHEYSKTNGVNTDEDGKCNVCGKECSHTFGSDSVCDVCGFTCTAHVYDKTGDVNTDVDGKCNRCGKECSHTFGSDSVCDVCGYTCTAHVYDKTDGVNTDGDGKCNRCGASCTHSFGDDNVCDVCGFTCTAHVYDKSETDATKNADADGKCNICGVECAHHFTADPTSGDMVCDKCGLVCKPHVYDKSSDGTKNADADGKCNRCGEECTHSYDQTDDGTSNVDKDGRCNTCGKECAHHFVADDTSGDMVCDVCGYTCTHSFGDDNVCDVCGFTCTTHVYDKSKTDATKNEDADGKCNVCGVKCDHTFGTDRKCTLCGYTLMQIRVDNLGTVGEDDIYPGVENVLSVSGGANEAMSVTILKAAIAKAADKGTIDIISYYGVVKFSNEAVTAMKDADADIVLSIHEEAASADEAAGTHHFILKVNNGDITDFNGNVDLALYVGEDEPKEVVHIKGDGTEEKFYLTSIDGSGTFVYENHSAKITVKSFSEIITSPKAEGEPVITTASLPNATKGEAYSVTIAYTGEDVTLKLTGDLPEGLTFDATTGKISGTPTKATEGTTPTFKITATNKFGEAEAELGITVITAKNYELVSKSTGKSEFYASFADAQTAAVDGDTIKALVDSTDPIDISKSIIFNGGEHNVGVVNVSGKDATVTDVKSSKLTAASGAKATLNGKNVINTVVSNPTSTVNITAGTYEHLYGKSGTNTANSGTYAVSGGSFGSEVPMDYCLRDVKTNASVTQYMSAKEGNRWGITTFVPKIESVDHSAYFMYRSTNTLSFTTNVPYDLIDKGDLLSVSVDATSRTLRDSEYSLSKNSAGNAVITLSNVYLKTLANEKKYTFTMSTKEGNASEEFHVSSSAKTGDSSNLTMWMWIMGGSVLVLCIAAAFIVLKSKKKSSDKKVEKLKNQFDSKD